ncbi:hypothetical protein N7U66_12155 [Lacinutrix neustonica]|uniref:Uncharacterized protein n=1 Tax=Lacinutrix neustonica TaxID=2980107 RepID=A0A9E8MUL8_9FLAO|nr:hypothetical protein [Lacinutrix neustonica]WAC00957.1 hypothetical protein N7U66_12155 [Lacinutrix neustonica]
MTLTAIIIEDLMDAMELLKRDIESGHPELTIVDTAQSVVEAAKALRKQEPRHLVFRYYVGRWHWF